VTHSRPAPARRWRLVPLHAADRPLSTGRVPAGPGGEALPGRDRGGAWLRYAIAALGVLAAAAAVVSWDAQYVMVGRARHTPAIAALEAGIPDAGAVIFAALGIALALHGRRALRPRTLNVACVGISLAMNAMAAGRGWRDVAIWIMPAAVYALASDTLIGVVRARALARMRPGKRSIDGEEVTPLAVLGAVLLWLLRLALAPASTLAGFRRWVVEECPVAPGRVVAAVPPAPLTLLPAGETQARRAARRRRDGRPGKQDLLIALASQRHDLRRVPLGQVARIAGDIGAEVDLHQGTARRVLRAHVLTLQNDVVRTGRSEAAI
jgi:hypothetical protein